MSKRGRDYLNSLTTEERLRLYEQVRSEHRNKWLEIIEQYNAYTLQKRDLANLLREGSTPIPEALDIIADIIEGKGKPLKTGTPEKVVLVNGHHVNAREYAMGTVDALIYLGWPLEKAKAEACRKLGVSKRSIENWRKEKP